MPLTETERVKLRRFLQKIPPHQQVDALQYAFTRTKQDRYSGLDAATARGLKNPYNLADNLVANPYAKFLMPAHVPFQQQTFIGPRHSHGFWWDLADTIHNWTGKTYGGAKDWLQSRFPEPMQALQTMWELWKGAEYELGGQLVDVGVTGVQRLFNPAAQSRLQQIRNSPEYQQDPVPFEAGRIIGSIALWEYLGTQGLFSRTKVIEPLFGLDVGRAAKVAALAGTETGLGAKAGGATTEEAVQHGLFAAGVAVPFDAVFQGVEGIIRANVAAKLARERSPFYGQGVNEYYEELLNQAGPQGEAGWFRRWMGRVGQKQGAPQASEEAIFGRRVSEPIEAEFTEYPPEATPFQRMFQPAQVPARRTFGESFAPPPVAEAAEPRVFAMGGPRRTALPLSETERIEQFYPKKDFFEAVGGHYDRERAWQDFKVYALRYLRDNNLSEADEGWMADRLGLFRLSSGPRRIFALGEGDIALNEPIGATAEVPVPVQEWAEQAPKAAEIVAASVSARPVRNDFTGAPQGEVEQLVQLEKTHRRLYDKISNARYPEGFSESLSREQERMFEIEDRILDLSRRMESRGIEPRNWLPARRGYDQIEAISKKRELRTLRYLIESDLRSANQSKSPTFWVNEAKRKIKEYDAKLAALKKEEPHLRFPTGQQILDGDVPEWDRAHEPPATPKPAEPAPRTVPASEVLSPEELRDYEGVKGGLRKALGGQAKPASEVAAGGKSKSVSISRADSRQNIIRNIQKAVIGERATAVIDEMNAALRDMNANASERNFIEASYGLAENNPYTQAIARFEAAEEKWSDLKAETRDAWAPIVDRFVNEENADASFVESERRKYEDIDYERREAQRAYDKKPTAKNKAALEKAREESDKAALRFRDIMQRRAKEPFIITEVGLGINPVPLARKAGGAVADWMEKNLYRDTTRIPEDLAQDVVNARINIEQFYNTVHEYTKGFKSLAGSQNWDAVQEVASRLFAIPGYTPEIALRALTGIFHGNTDKANQMLSNLLQARLDMYMQVGQPASLQNYYTKVVDGAEEIFKMIPPWTAGRTGDQYLPRVSERTKRRLANIYRKWLAGRKMKGIGDRDVKIEGSRWSKAHNGWRIESNIFPLGKGKNFPRTERHFIAAHKVLPDGEVAVNDAGYQDAHDILRTYTDTDARSNSYPNRYHDWRISASRVKGSIKAEPEEPIGNATMSDELKALGLDPNEIFFKLDRTKPWAGVLTPDSVIRLRWIDWTYERNPLSKTGYNAKATIKWREFNREELKDVERFIEKKNKETVEKLHITMDEPDFNTKLAPFSERFNEMIQAFQDLQYAKVFELWSQRPDVFPTDPSKLGLTNAALSDEQRALVQAIQAGEIEYAKVPEHIRFGMLAGRYIPKEWMYEIESMTGYQAEELTKFQAAIERIMRFFKVNKTADDPATVTRQLITNFFVYGTYLDVNPFVPGRWHYWVKAADIMWRRDSDLYFEMVANDIIGQTVASTEFGAKQGIRSSWDELREALGENPIKPGMSFINGLIAVYDKLSDAAAKGQNVLSAAYGFADPWTKAAGYLRAKDKGMSPVQAAREAKKYSPTYGRYIPGLQKVVSGKAGVTSAFVTPFGSFQIENTRINAHALHEKPLSFAAVYGLPWIIRLATMTALGYGLQEIFDSDYGGRYNTKNAMQMIGDNASFYRANTPWTIAIPVRKKDGGFYTWDLTSLLPGSEYLDFDMAEPERRTWVQNIMRYPMVGNLFFGNPIMKLLYGMYENENPYSGKPIASPEKSGLDIGIDTARWIWDSIGISILGGYKGTQIKQAVTGEKIAGYSVDYNGAHYEWDVYRNPQTTLLKNLLGIRIELVEPFKEALMRHKGLEKYIDELEWKKERGMRISNAKLEAAKRKLADNEKWLNYLQGQGLTNSLVPTY